MSGVTKRMLVPLDHYVNYHCRSLSPMAALTNLCLQAIPISAAIQSLIAPSRPHAWVRLAGLAALIFGDALVTWAWRVNPAFLPQIIYVPIEKRVRCGPYRFCAHPGYVGFISIGAGMTCLLGQSWATAPAIGYVTLVLCHLWHERRVLG